MKYSWEFKLECAIKYKNGEFITLPVGLRSRTSFMERVRLWVQLFNDLGVDGLKHSSTSKKWTPEKRFELVAKVLAGNSVNDVAKKGHVNSGQLYQWVRKYNERGMDGLQCKQGRPSGQFVMKKKTIIDTLTQEATMSLKNSSMKSLRKLQQVIHIRHFQPNIG